MYVFNEENWNLDFICTVIGKLCKYLKTKHDVFANICNKI